VIIQKFVWSMVIVGLPNANIVQSIPISKLDYTTPYYDCQMENLKNTMDFNYITTKELLESNIKKYQDVLW